jgi:TolB-like protein/Tfp pilus assembly protein PilF
MPPPGPPVTFRFGDFELDVTAYELRRAGTPVRLERRPMDLLILLVERRRQLVSRADIVERLWGEGVFVDVEMGVNTAMRKVRLALRDPAEKPVFVETIPGKGYRFVADVEVVGAATPDTPSRVTVAVLPFENLSHDPEREYLADGLTDETIAVLGQIDPERLGVIGRTSVMAYKRTTRPLAEIGRELGAVYLVESSIRAEGARLRITSKLIRVRDQVQVWAASYDSEPSSMFAFQRELSAVIAEQVRLRLSPERLTALARRQTRDAEAYDLYLRGRHSWNHFTPPTTRRALEYFTRATALDPDYALAWSGLADAYSAAPINGDAPPLQVWPLAREAAAQAIRAEPDLAEAQASVGLEAFWLEWDWLSAEAAFRRAIALDPGYAFAHRQLGIVLACQGGHQEAQQAMRRGRELDPLNPIQHALSAQVAFQARAYGDALQFARQAAVVDEFWIGYYQLAQAHEQMGDDDLALEAVSHAVRIGGGNSKAMALRGYIFAKQGRTTEAEDVLQTLEAIARERYLPPYAIALVRAGLGQMDRVVDSLRRAREVHDVHLVLVVTDPKWDGLRRHAAIAEVLERCGFEKQARPDPLRSV